jgi:hypothetical protein
MGVGGQRHATAALVPGKRLSTHGTGGWVGCWSGLDGCKIFRPPPAFDYGTIQPVTSRYTNYAIAAYLAAVDFSQYQICPSQKLSHRSAGEDIPAVA